MFKKITIAIVVAFLSSATFAVEPYVGLSLGVNHTQFDTQSLSDDSTTHVGATHPALNAFAGVGGIVNERIYLGGEFFINTVTGTYNAPNDAPFVNPYLRYRSVVSYGLSFIPGIMLDSNTKLYVRAGVVHSDFNIVTSAENFYENSNKLSLGAQAGVGVQHQISEHVDLRGEYVYSNYHAFDSNGLTTSPRSNQFNVGLVYKFGTDSH